MKSSLVMLRFAYFMIGISHVSGLTKAPVPPLAERVLAAEMVFVGTLIERVENGEWVRAVLQVDEPLRGVGEQKRVEVIWRSRIGGQPIYDAAERQRGIAILDAKHEGRYWLRADKFEPLDKLADVIVLLAVEFASRNPTFEEWIRNGKPIPSFMAFPGDSLWTDEATGKKHSDEAVYEMIFGPPPTEPRPLQFPEHWGSPPSVTTLDRRPLPAGYGEGSTSLANWIRENMKKDAGTGILRIDQNAVPAK